MEQIEIKGFLTIEHAVFEIKKINVLIGEQAQGKSVIAKLVYFFTSHFIEIFLESIQNFETEQDIEKKCLAKFRRIFPAYTWQNDCFSIFYKSDHYDLTVTRIKCDDQYVLSFKLSPDLAKFQKDICDAYKLNLEHWKKGDDWMSPRSRSPEDVLSQMLRTYDNRYFFHPSKKVTGIPLNAFIQHSVFIPAGRSFFAMLQKNIFSFLSKDIDIDPFIKEFGWRYQAAKETLQSDPNMWAENRGIVKLCSDITKGEYFYQDNQDWIQDNDRRVNLVNASSGQQESLPMLLILRVFAFAKHRGRLFIEEPEAHLFPHSQKQVVSLIAKIYKKERHDFFITTHSPYILTAINNLVIGQDAYDKVKDNPEKLAALEKVLPASQLIRLEDVSAYTLKNGKLESIINWENRLIGANLLDAVSDEFEESFNVASDMLYGDEE